MNAQIEEAFTGNTIIKAFNIQDEMIQTTSTLNEDLCEKKKAKFITYVINPIIQFMNHLGYVVIAIGGAILVLNGSISIGYVLKPSYNILTKYQNQYLHLPISLIRFKGQFFAAERIYQIEDELEETSEIEKKKDCCRQYEEICDLKMFVSVTRKIRC